MTIAWNNKNKWVDPSDRNSNVSFMEHAERMRVFSQSHACDREARAALLERMSPLWLSLTLTETGGEKGLIGTIDWLALVPMSKTWLFRFSQS